MLPSESDELEPSKVHVCPLHANVNAAEGRLVGTPLHGLHVGPYPASPTGPQAHSPVTVTKEINEWKPFGFFWIDWEDLGKHDARAVRRPVWSLRLAFACCERSHVGAIWIHDGDLRAAPSRCDECDSRAVRRPVGLAVALAVGESREPRAVRIDSADVVRSDRGVDDAAECEALAVRRPCRVPRRSEAGNDS